MAQTVAALAVLGFNEIEKRIQLLEFKIDFDNRYFSDFLYFSKFVSMNFIRKYELVLI